MVYISITFFLFPLLQGKEDDRTLKDNYQFYANEIPSSPDGDFIDMIHSEWMGQYDRLEYHHGYIQWYVEGTNLFFFLLTSHLVWHLGGYRLFPIRERGMNYHSQELQLHEAEVRRSVHLCAPLCTSVHLTRMYPCHVVPAENLF